MSYLNTHPKERKKRGSRQKSSKAMFPLPNCTKLDKEIGQSEYQLLHFPKPALTPLPKFYITVQPLQKEQEFTQKG